jgi:nucleoid-associated protein YgaU
MADPKKGGILGGIVDAVTTRDEVAAAKAAKAEAEAAKKEAADALARLNQEVAKRQEAEARAAKAEAALKAAQQTGQAAAADQQIHAAQMQVLQNKVQAAEAEVARLKQALEAAKVRTYVVKSGDSLSKIAQQFYGDAKRWPEIFEANKDKIKDPNVINVGQELRIP